MSRAVADRLGLERLDGGTVWRSLAAELGYSVAEFSALCEEDPSYDLELDRRLADRARLGDVVLESRLAGWIATNEGLGGTRVWLACDAGERARRVAEREGSPPEEAARQNARRQASEAARYRQYYGIDIDDLTPYDLVLDSTSTAPPRLVEAILRAAAPAR